MTHKERNERILRDLEERGIYLSHIIGSTGGALNVIGYDVNGLTEHITPGITTSVKLFTGVEDKGSRAMHALFDIELTNNGEV